jgi:hypothetical protein
MRYENPDPDQDEEAAAEEPGLAPQKGAEAAAEIPPRRAQAKVIKPMKAETPMMSKRITAKPTPTASASMLVATA